MASEKIVITTDELREPGEPLATPQPSASNVPVWWRILSVLLILCPPILFVVSIVALLRARHRELTARHACALHYCWLLLASGIFWTFLLIALAIWTPPSLSEHVARPSPLSFHSFPSLPSTGPLSGKDIARQMSPLVVVVHQAEAPFFPSCGGDGQSCGTGAVVFAGRGGCMVVTSRHVVDALAWSAQLGCRVGVTLQDGQQADATVVGLHRNLDLALLWIACDEADTQFVQPLRGFKTIEVGEQVFVIGHPEGLEFSLSGGLVAQTRGDDMIQLSAPVSPGNSGGPVYDVHGRLIAVVQSVFDKTRSPNAENLNFAVRADDLLNPDAWVLSKDGQTLIFAFAGSNKYGNDESPASGGNVTKAKKGD
jgi:S1-C subfamily serine protease